MRSSGTADRVRRAVATFVAASLAIACGSSAQQPPASPVAPAAAVTQLPAELSTITIPIHTTLAPLLPQIEAQVPAKMAKLDAYELDPQKQYGVKYDVRRKPVAIQMIGSGIHATTTVQYALEGCRRTQKPLTNEFTMWPCLSCGFAEPMREAYIAIDSHLEWDENWRLKTKTNARPVEFGENRCRIFGIDISDWKIGPIVNDQLRDVAKTIDKQTPKLTNVRPTAQQIWTSLQTPVEIAAKTWLVLEPDEVALEPITGSGLDVSSAITLRARTRVVVGERPQPSAKPLPPLRVAKDAGRGIRVPLLVDVPYAEASRLLTEQFGKKTYKVGGRDLAVDSIRLFAGANGKVTIEAKIDYRAYHGLIYLDGEPVLANGEFALRDVQYTLDPKRHNLFLRTLDRVAHEGVRANIAANAHWPLGPQLTSLREEVQRALTRQLAPGVQLHGKVEGLELQSVTPMLDGLEIRALATGNAAVDVSKW